MNRIEFSSIQCVFCLTFLFLSTCFCDHSFAQTSTPTTSPTVTETPTNTPTPTPVTPNPVTPSTGYLQWPRNDHRRINSTFGEYRSSHYHLGVDMPGGNKELALASVDGVVTYRKKNVPYAGNVVTILDSNGYLINYLHLHDEGFDSAFPKVNTPVAAGTPIGKIGKTGTGHVHLHYEIRSVQPTPGAPYGASADAYNPLSWLETPWTPTPTTGNRPPYHNNIYVVPEGSNSKIWVKTPAPYAVPLSTPKNSVQIPLPFQSTPTPKVFHAQGRLQFMLDTWDRINHTSGKVGVYDVGYKVEGESNWKYRIKFDEIPREFKRKEELIYNKSPPAFSNIGPTRFIYRLFMPDSATPTPTPPMIVEAESTNLGVFDTQDYPNGTPVVLQFAASTKEIGGFPAPTPKVEEIIIIPHNADRWVDCETGDDFMNDCTDEADPCLTITHALDVAVPGDVIAVAPGICDDTGGEIFPLNLKEGVALEGSGYSFPANGGTVIQSSSSPNLIACEDILDPPVVQSFWIVSGYSGIYIENSNPLIKNCQISANYDSGIRCDAGSHPDIKNCLIRSNGGAGISIINTGTENDVLIENCTILNNQDGIACLPYASAMIRDSIVIDNGGYGLFINSLSEGDTIEYCDFWNNSSGHWNLSPLVGTGVIHLNPQHVSGTYGSYYLSQSGPVSPCLDSGSASSVSAGIDGRTTDPVGWFDAGRVDMGFHHKAIVPTATPTPTVTPTSTPSSTPTGPTSTPTSGPSHTPLPTDTPFPTAVAVEFFNEGFENGFADWNWTGLWHPVSNNVSSPYYSSYAEVAEGDLSFWYGQNSTGDYETRSGNSGSLTSPVVIIGDFSTLIFNSWEQTEGTSFGFDTRKVLISMDYGETWTPIWSSTDNSSEYHNVVIDLGGYRYLPIQLRFEFDTVDDQFNDFRGWFIDDISIGLGPIPSTNFIGLIILVICMSIGIIARSRK